MNINTITLTPCIITNDLSTEESVGYTHFLQTYDIKFTNIMNLHIENFNDSDSDAKEIKKNFPFPVNAENLPAAPQAPIISIKMSDEGGLHVRSIQNPL